MSIKARNDVVELIAINFKHEFEKGLKEVLAQHDTRASCITCRNFDPINEVCKLYNARPPAHVIAYACEKYDDADEIPF